MTSAELAFYQDQDPTLAARGQEILTEILERSSTDWDFRSLLVSDPYAALEAHTGSPVARDIELGFVETQAEADGRSGVLALPRFRDANEELSEEDLEAVAGGEGGVVVAIAIATVVVLAIDKYTGSDTQN